MKKRFTEDQLTKAITRLKNGTPIKELSCEIGVTPTTLEALRSLGLRNGDTCSQGWRYGIARSKRRAIQQRNPSKEGPMKQNRLAWADPAQKKCIKLNDFCKLEA